jgi:hypothetical protein
VLPCTNEERGSSRWQVTPAVSSDGSYEDPRQALSVCSNWEHHDDAC